MPYSNSAKCTKSLHGTVKQSLLQMQENQSERGSSCIINLPSLNTEASRKNALAQIQQEAVCAVRKTI